MAKADQSALDRLLNWARSNWIWSPPADGELAEAQRLGMTEVAEALAENPYLVSGLMRGAQRGEMMDEPGLLMGRAFVLRWSRLKPTELLGRLIATAAYGAVDLLAEASRVARETAERKPHIRAALESSFSIYQTWWTELQPALAVGWIRFRARGQPTQRITPPAWAE